MLISKFDLYKNEWLDLVFTDRNRSYGAYELRQHNSRNTVMALGAMVASILVVAFVFGVVLRQPVKPLVKMIPVVNPYLPPPVQPVKPVQPKVPKAPEPAHQQMASVKFTQMVVTTDNKAVEPPKKEDLDDKAISDIDAAGPKGQPTVDVTPGPPTPPAPTGTEVYDANAGGLEREPMPVGGMAAFSKFISKHLHFPPEAQEAHVGGKVFLSFIVERDGSLSSFTILRGPGYGTNEEALRVLKLAPAWIPGLQNNHPVRVQYNIPINFQLGDEDGN